MRCHLKEEGRAVRNQRPSVTVLPGRSMFHLLALEDPRLGSKTSQADGWVSHSHLPSSTVCSVFPF